jgi:hypothetical protein
MNTICQACGVRFSARQALCDDWRDGEKSFGCPDCGTFFVRDLRPKYGESLFYGLLGGGVATPAIFVLKDALRDGDTKSAETIHCSSGEMNDWNR